MLDGFDELLQATGVSQTDYLVKIAKLQLREADQGRPLAVIVTSRTSVADRARAPEGTVALRLEPFDDKRVERWLSTWNTSNALHFAAHGLDSLTSAAVLRHRDLAGQPLLLLLLALYDADGNPLQKLSGDLGQGELYGRLLRAFAAREVLKHRPSLADHHLKQAVETELHRLSVVGLAMFNRGTQWITEADLESDLTALFGSPKISDHQGLRAPLTASESVLGSFFFIHRSQASRNGFELRTYEFLHATFGEFLVARFVWLALREAAARHAVSTFGLGAGIANDDRLQALLSFVPLSSRAPILGFLVERASVLSAAERTTLTDFVIKVFRTTHEPRPPHAYVGYQPRRLPVTARHAAYSANLVLLAVSLADTLTAGRLFAATVDRVQAWHREVLLWRSQLSSEDWSGIGNALALHRIWDGEQRDVGLEVATGEIKPPPISPAWTYEVSGWGDRVDFYGQHSAKVLLRKGYLQCGNLDDVILHTLTPLLSELGKAVNTFSGSDSEDYVSAAHMLMGAWLLPLNEVTDEKRRHIYLRCARMAASLALDADERIRYASLLLDRLATDSDASVTLMVEVIQIVSGFQDLATSEIIKSAAARCGLARLEPFSWAYDTDAERLAELLIFILSAPSRRDSLPISQVWVRLAEAGVFRVDQYENCWPQWPDLSERLFQAMRATRPKKRK